MTTLLLKDRTLLCPVDICVSKRVVSTAEFGGLMREERGVINQHRRFGRMQKMKGRERA